MTLDEFNNLSEEGQEFFLTNGGRIPRINQQGTKTDTSGHSPSQISETVEVKESVVVSPSTPPDSPAGVISPVYTDGFDIRDPVELLLLLDDDIAAGKVKLHEWQVRFLLDFASSDFTYDSPFQALVRACNGSGKDKYIIAPCVVWLCMRHTNARGIVTSSSGVQLDNQTCKYISMLAEAANRKWGKLAGNQFDIWKINYRFYECLATGSPVICYATDEPGKAEGFHPLRADAKMGIFVSEDKSVPDEINAALNRCSGYTHRVHVSTPGLPLGHFHDMCAVAVDRNTLENVRQVNPEDYIQYHITYKECSHIKESDYKRTVRDTPGGEHSAIIKSQFWAEFGTTDEMVVIPYTFIWKAKARKLSEWIPEEYNKAGVDLSDGGDETVLAVRNGNRLLAVIPFKFDDTTLTEKFLDEKFREWKLNNPQSRIFGDAGGLGKPILDHLRAKGWTNIRYCDNRAKSSRPKTYRNWGAESWFNFRQLLQGNELILIDDSKLVRQLSTRYYKIADGAIHQLLSKIEMRSRGYPSPDRADAVVLAFADYKAQLEDISLELEKQNLPFEQEKEAQIVGDFSTKAHARGYSSGPDRYRKWNPNGGAKDFSYLQEEIADYNRLILTNKKG